MGQGRTDGDAWAELDALMGCEQMARPARPLVSGPDRDPSPTWDYWYESISPAERRQLLPFMAPAGGGVSPDTLATELFCSVDTALEVWREACQAVRLERRRARTVAERISDPSSAEYAAEWEAFDAEQLRRAGLSIMGPQEYAKHLGISVPALWKRRERGKLAPADLIISGVPLWHVDTVTAHEEDRHMTKPKKCDRCSTGLMGDPDSHSYDCTGPDRLWKEEWTTE